jgi:hypothetical protein
MVTLLFAVVVSMNFCFSCPADGELVPSAPLPVPKDQSMPPIIPLTWIRLRSDVWSWQPIHGGSFELLVLYFGNGRIASQFYHYPVRSLVIFVGWTLVRAHITGMHLQALTLIRQTALSKSPAKNSLKKTMPRLAKIQVLVNKINSHTMCSYHQKNN